MIALLLLGPAHAAGLDADVELLRPTFSSEALPGIDSPALDEAGTWRVGGVVQYERDPLVLYERRDELGVVIEHRQALQLGFSYDFSRSVSTRLLVPSALSWGTDLPEVSRDGPALGDLGVGLRLRVHSNERWTAGVRADLMLPTSTRGAWMGERLPRGLLGPLASVRLGPVDLLADLGIQVREDVPTYSDFTLGSEFVGGLGARYHLWPERVAFTGGLLYRSGLNYMGLGGAETSSELLTGLEIQPVPSMRWQIGAGKGLAEGYGTTEFRALLGLTWIHRPPPPERPLHLEITAIPEDNPNLVITEVPPDEDVPTWGEEELARVEGEKIIIRDEIQFEFNTERILPESIPTLHYVARLLFDNWQIAHLVVEGHASEEGSYLYNYDLSIRRARSVWEELIRAGVHPDRMSYRGMGETVPRLEGEDEASLARNRRVEFRIVKQYAEGEAPEGYRERVRLPWSGDAAAIDNPAPPPPKEPPPPKTDPDRINLDQFDPDELDPGDLEPGDSQPGDPQPGDPQPGDPPPAQPDPTPGAQPPSEPDPSKPEEQP